MFFSSSSSVSAGPPAILPSKGGKYASLQVQDELKKMPYALSTQITRVKTANARKSKQRKGRRNGPKVNSDGKSWSVLSSAVPATSLPRQVQNQPYNICQEVDCGTVLNTSNTVPTFGSLSFTLSQLDQVSTFTALFDQYRINLIELWIKPALGANNVFTDYTSVIDFDDDSNLGSYSAALDYTNAVTTYLSEGHYRVFQPHIAVAAYSGAFTSFANEPAPWIDAASTGVKHYGLKLAAKVAIVNASPINVTARLHISFRNVR